MISALDNVHLLEEWGRRDWCGASSSPIESVGILGAGMMGRAIAAAHVAHRLPVVICDVNESFLAEATASLAAELMEDCPDLRVNGDGAAASSDRSRGVSRLVRATLDPAEAARCDLVLESVVESFPTKQRLLAELGPHVASHAIVASNTSTIPIGRLAESLSDASRFCGMHFLYPVRHRPLVEIVCGPCTSDGTIAAAAAHIRRIGKMPIVVRDGPGFLVNRLLFPYLGEALELLREGVRAEAIEQGAAEFGMAIGPLRLMDEIGLDTTLQAAWVLAAAFPERIVSSPLLVSMIKAGRLGRKAGAGFYAYDKSSDPTAVGAAGAAFEEILARWVEPRRESPREPIALRLVLPMLLEATRILDEGKVLDPRSVDLAALFGLGFPPDKGGLLWWADSLGPERVLAMLRSHGAPGDRHLPTSMLLTLAKTGGHFYRGLS
jgi:3-hydroxyacyl-CoA dehydrogenase